MKRLMAILAVALALVVVSVPAPAQAATYKTYDTYYSKTAVREVYRAIENINSVCGKLPLSYFASLGCRAPATMEAAFVEAYWTNHRVLGRYYLCNMGNYCSYTKYYVIT